MTKTATPTQKPTRALNEISKDYIELNFLLDSIEDEISPEQQTQLNEFLQGLETDRNKKVDAYCAVIRELEARGAVRKAEADRISKLSGYVANRAKRLKWLLLNFLQTQGMEKIETDFNVIRRSAITSKRCG